MTVSKISTDEKDAIIPSRIPPSFWLLCQSTQPTSPRPFRHGVFFSCVSGPLSCGIATGVDMLKNLFHPWSMHGDIPPRGDSWL